MSKEAYERKLREIEALRTAPAGEAVSQLRRALKDRSNYLVSKAAGVAGDRRLNELCPDLLLAFEQMMAEPVKRDPQCWAKGAIIKALKDLEHTDAAVFVRGIGHVQMEPVWGKLEDTAATLRGACAMGLIASDLDSFQALLLLTDLLGDAETPARIDAARAIAQLAAKEGALPLRLKARLGDSEPEVVGHCLAALLSLNPRDALPFVAGFLRHADPEIRMEAVGVLTESREPEALESIEEFLGRQTDPAVHRAVLALLGTSPQSGAAGYLLSLMESASESIAVGAVAALAKSRYAASSKERALAIVSARGSAAMAAAFESSFP